MAGGDGCNPSDEGHHILLGIGMFRRPFGVNVGTVEIDPIEAGRLDPRQIAVRPLDHNALPFRIPKAHDVVAGPQRVHLAEPGGLARGVLPGLIPVIAIALSLADRQIGENDAPGAIGLAARDLDQLGRELMHKAAVNGEGVIDHHEIERGRGDLGKADLAELVAPALDGLERAAALVGRHRRRG